MNSRVVSKEGAMGNICVYIKGGTKSILEKIV